MQTGVFSYVRTSFSPQAEKILVYRLTQIPLNKKKKKVQPDFSTVHILYKHNFIQMWPQYATHQNQFPNNFNLSPPRPTLAIKSFRLLIRISCFLSEWALYVLASGYAYYKNMFFNSFLSYLTLTKVLLLELIFLKRLKSLIPVLI